MWAMVLPKWMWPGQGHGEMAKPSFDHQQTGDKRMERHRFSAFSVLPWLRWLMRDDS